MPKCGLEKANRLGKKKTEKRSVSMTMFPTDTRVHAVKMSQSIPVPVCDYISITYHVTLQGARFIDADLFMFECANAC